MRYVAQELGWARKGSGGEDGADPGAVGWISFRHHTARPTLPVQDGPAAQTYLFDAPVAGDPHTHIHNFLMNIVVTRGRADRIARHSGADRSPGQGVRRLLPGGARRRAAAPRCRRSAMTQNEQAVVVAGDPGGHQPGLQQARQADPRTRPSASRRARASTGTTSRPTQKLDIVEEASAEGRLGKMKADERRLWREQAEALGWKHETVIGETRHVRLSDDERFDRAYEFAARHLADEFHTAAVIDHEKLGLYAARGLIGAGIAGGPDDIKRVVELIEERGIRIDGEHVALVVGLFDDKVRVSQHRADPHRGEAAKPGPATRTRPVRRARRSRRCGGRWTAAGIEFTAEQSAAIYALGEGGALTLLTGAAGVGKTTMLEPLVAAWKADTRFSATAGR